MIIIVLAIAITIERMRQTQITVLKIIANQVQVLVSQMAQGVIMRKIKEKA